MAAADRLPHRPVPRDAQGHDPSGTTLALFSLHGFHDDVVKAGDRRNDVLLVDLPALYGIRVPVVRP